MKLSYGVAVGKAVIVAVGGTFVAVGTDVAVFGTLVDVGSTVSVKGNGVKVSGSVGTSVCVLNCGIKVIPGVMVGTLGTHNCKPTGMALGLVMQLARCNSAAAVRYRSAMRYRSSPG